MSPETTSTPLPKAFDKEKFLERLMNDEGLARIIAQTAAIDLRNRIKELDLACQQDDLSSAHIALHAIKGSSGNIDCMPLCMQAAKMEVSLKREGLPQAAAMLEDLKQVFYDTESQLIAFIC